MKLAMRGFLHLTEREKSNVVRLAHFFKCPANAHVTRQSSAAIGRPFKSSDGGNHRNAPGDCITLSIPAVLALGALAETGLIDPLVGLSVLLSFMGTRSLREYGALQARTTRRAAEARRAQGSRRAQ